MATPLVNRYLWLDCIHMDVCQRECIITSARDGEHKPGSKHFSGEAIDIRINDLPRDKINVLYGFIKNSMEKDFDIVLESDHIHIEYDPKP